MNATPRGSFVCHRRISGSQDASWWGDWDEMEQRQGRNSDESRLITASDPCRHPEFLGQATPHPRSPGINVGQTRPSIDAPSAFCSSVHQPTEYSSRPPSMFDQGGKIWQKSGQYQISFINYLCAKARRKWGCLNALHIIEFFLILRDHHILTFCA